MTAPHSNDVPKSDLVATQADLEGKANSNHNHDDRYVRLAGNNTVSGNLSMDGGNLDLVRPETTGGWARGVGFTGRDGTRYGQVGAYGQADALTYVYFAYGQFSGTGIRLYPDEVVAAGNFRVTGTITSPSMDAKQDKPTSGTASSSTYLRGDGTWATPTNTTYTVMSEAEATAGTATTARATSAAGLKGAIQRWATGTYSTAISAIGQALNRAATAADARTAIGAAADNHTHTTAQVTGLDSALAGKVIASGATTTLWTGSQSAYDALPTATRNAVGFIAVIV